MGLSKVYLKTMTVSELKAALDLTRKEIDRMVRR